jgi:hypothetical protein
MKVLLQDGGGCPMTREEIEEILNAPIPWDSEEDERAVLVPMCVCRTTTVLQPLTIILILSHANSLFVILPHRLTHSLAHSQDLVSLLPEQDVEIAAQGSYA